AARAFAVPRAARRLSRSGRRGSGPACGRAAIPRGARHVAGCGRVWRRARAVRGAAQRRGARSGGRPARLSRYRAGGARALTTPARSPWTARPAACYAASHRRPVMLKEFKEFAMRGNVLDLAIGVIIGAAFGKIVSSFVSDVLMPPIGKLMGGVDFSN